MIKSSFYCKNCSSIINEDLPIEEISVINNHTPGTLEYTMRQSELKNISWLPFKYFIHCPKCGSRHMLNIGKGGD